MVMRAVALRFPLAPDDPSAPLVREEIKRRSEGYHEQVLVVCPALNAPLRHWVSDEDAAREYYAEHGRWPDEPA